MPRNEKQQQLNLVRTAQQLSGCVSISVSSFHFPAFPYVPHFGMHLYLLIHLRFTMPVPRKGSEYRCSVVVLPLGSLRIKASCAYKMICLTVEYWLIYIKGWLCPCWDCSHGILQANANSWTHHDKGECGFDSESGRINQFTIDNVLL